MISQQDTEIDIDGTLVEARVFDLDLDPAAVIIPQYLTQVKKLQLQVLFMCDDTIRLKFLDRESQRYEVPVPILKPGMLDMIWK